MYVQLHLGTCVSFWGVRTARIVCMCLLSGATLSLRFPSAATCGLEGLLNNSIPLPALSFLSVSYAPLISKSLLPFYKATTKDITLEAFKQRQSLFSALQAEGMFLTANLLYR